MRRSRSRELPDWLLAFGPFLVIATLIAAAFAILSVIELDAEFVTGTIDVLVFLTVIGFIAGILPVAVGMLWFPYFRRLDAGWVNAVLAFSAGILAFIAFEMADEAIEFAAEVPTPMLGEGVAIAGAVTTAAAMELGSRWRRKKTSEAAGQGLRVAYLVAIGLGLHSIGEGLAIGSAFVLGEFGFVALLTVGFIIHNVTEGPAVIAALAREHAAPPLRHFVALGVLAGGGVIIGGWIGSLADSALVAALFFAIAFGAIVQVLWEMTGLVRADAERLFTPRIVSAFVLGVLVLFFLEEIVVDAWLL